MSTTDDSILRQLLIDFLKGDTVAYKPVTANIIQTSPFLISDDKRLFIESCS